MQRCVVGSESLSYQGRLDRLHLEFPELHRIKLDLHYISNHVTVLLIWMYPVNTDRGEFLHHPRGLMIRASTRGVGGWGSIPDCVTPKT